MVDIDWLAHTWFKLSESSPPYPVAWRGGAKRGDAPGIERVKPVVAPPWKKSFRRPCLLCEIIFVEEFYTFTKRGTESALFLFSAAHSTFCRSAKIK